MQLFPPLVYAPITQVTKANIKSNSGNLVSVFISNANAAVRYLQLFDMNITPVAGTSVPLYPGFPIPAGSANDPGNLILDHTFFNQVGKNFTSGISWAISTTYGTFTDSATPTDHVIVAHYTPNN